MPPRATQPRSAVQDADSHTQPHKRSPRYCALGPTDAWNVLKNQEFHFIMLDVKMPDHDGLEVVQWIREETDSYFKEIPIFALTSFSSSGYTQQVLKAGMNAHLTKPLEINILMEHLEKYFPSK
jgi:CheY-like chemotaxis protein